LNLHTSEKCGRQSCDMWCLPFRVTTQRLVFKGTNPHININLEKKIVCAMQYVYKACVGPKIFLLFNTLVVFFQKGNICRNNPLHKDLGVFIRLKVLKKTI
jgi:hypothetical protein